MIRTGIYPQVIIAILGIAYPILFQIISKLDEKYASTRIVDLFMREWKKKFFQGALYLALSIAVLWSLCPLWSQDISAKSLSITLDIYLLVSVSILVVAFFLLVQQILVYSYPGEFVKYLMKAHDDNRKNIAYFEALSDIALQSIQKQNLGISEQLSGFFYQEFERVREEAGHKPVVYPKTHYSLIYKIIEELATQRGKKNMYFMDGAAGNAWLLGYAPEHKISEDTYKWLWWNLLLEVDHEKDEMVIEHWKNAYQYFQSCLEKIYPEYESGSTIPKNQEKIKKRQKEQDDFLELHYALGGLLLYKRRYSCIQSVLTYTQSQPPNYVLLPETMGEILSAFIFFRDPYGLNFWSIFKYGFTGQEGLNAEGVVKRWICSYEALLFLRQYSVRTYLIYQNPLDEPPMPQDQGEKTRLIENLDYFRRLLADLLENSELMRTLNYDFLTREWCNKEEKKYPLDWIDDFKNHLQDAYEESEKTLKPSQEKITKYFESSKEIIERKLDSYKTIENQEIISEPCNKWYVSGKVYPLNKDRLAETPEVDFGDYHSFLAGSLSKEISNTVSATFMVNSKKKYLLKREDLFEAVSKLDVDRNCLVVTFGIRLEYYVDQLRIPELTLRNYNDVPIIAFAGTPIVKHSAFILKKEALPNITAVDITESMIGKYSLKSISKKYNLFASVLDLNDLDSLRKEISGDKAAEELRKSALLCLILSIEIRWKKDVHLIQLNEHSEYRDDGPPNDLSEIKKLSG